MAQYVILSPQSQLIERDPEPSFLAAASISGSSDIVLLQFGHVIWFSISFPLVAVIWGSVSFQVLSMSKTQ